MNVRNSVLTACYATALACLVGCRMSVPIHLWQPPQLASAVGKRVALAGIVGPESIAEPLHAAVLEEVPSDSGRRVSLVDAQQWQDDTKIQLVSATDGEPNDVALASVARRKGFDYLLRGEVYSDRAPSQWSASSPQQSPAEVDRLIVSWRLTSLTPERQGGGQPVVIDRASVTDRYPDLEMLDDRRQAMVTAAARETHRLLAPSISRQQVQLEIAYWMPGSQQVRRGNAAALAGRWGEAARIWSEVVQTHPTQIAAIHNLAIAAAAAQDFSRAKRLARRAIQLHSSDHHQQTLVWIELRQRDYHAAFGLPTPPEGWFVTNGVAISAGSGAQFDQTTAAVAD